MPIGDPTRLGQLGVTVNAQLAERAMRHALFLEGLKSHEVKRILDLIDKEAIPALLKNLESNIAKNGGRFTRKRLRELTASNAAILNNSFSNISRKQVSRLTHIAKNEASWQLGAIKKAMPVNIALNSPSVSTMKTLVTDNPFGAFGGKNQVLGKWWSGLGTSTALAVEKTIERGIAAGSSVESIVKELGGLGKVSETAFGPLGQMKHRARSITRTAVAQVSQDTREESYKANSDVIKEVRIVATLDTRTSDICMTLDGRVYEVGKGPRPPFHFNCRTVTIPITKSYAELLGTKRAKELGLKELDGKKRAALGGEVPDMVKYPEWIKQQPDIMQDLALGKRDATLMRMGKFEPGAYKNIKGFRLSPNQVEQVDEIVEFAAKSTSKATKIDRALGTLRMARSGYFTGAEKATAVSQAKKIIKELDPDWKTKYNLKDGSKIFTAAEKKKLKLAAAAKKAKAEARKLAKAKSKAGVIKAPSGRAKALPKWKPTPLGDAAKGPNGWGSGKTSPPPPRLGNKPGAKLGKFDPDARVKDPFATIGLKKGAFKPEGTWQKALQPTTVDPTDLYETQFQIWKDSLTQAEKTAIKKYTGSSYGDIRRAISQGSPPARGDSSRYAQALRGAIDRAPQKQTLQFRGMHLSADDIEGKMFGGFKPGSVIEQNSVESWTERADIAKNFSKWNDNSRGRHPVMFVSHNKSGVDISRLAAKGVADEKEIISGVGKKYRVVKTEVVNANKSKFLAHTNTQTRYVVYVEEIFDDVPVARNPSKGRVVKVSKVNTSGMTPTQAKAARAKARREAAKSSASSAPTTSTKSNKTIDRIASSSDGKQIRRALKSDPAFKSIDSVSLGTASIDQQKRIATEMARFARDNPAAAQRVKVIRVAALDDDKMAVFRFNKTKNTGEMVFNSDVFNDSTKLRSILRKVKKDGTLLGNTVEHVVNHEVGHAIDMLSPTVSSRAKRYLRTKKPRKVDMSAYGFTNKAEMFAEAYGHAASTPRKKWSKWLEGFIDELRIGYEKSGIEIPDWMA